MKSKSFSILFNSDVIQLINQSHLQYQIYTLYKSKSLTKSMIIYTIYIYSPRFWYTGGEEVSIMEDDLGQAGEDDKPENKYVRSHLDPSKWINSSGRH